MPREYSRNCANTSSTLSSSSPRATFAQTTHTHTSTFTQTHADYSATAHRADSGSWHAHAAARHVGVVCARDATCALFVRCLCHVCEPYGEDIAARVLQRKREVPVEADLRLRVLHSTPVSTPQYPCEYSTVPCKYSTVPCKYPSRPTFACKALHRWYSMITRARSRLHRLRPAQVGPRPSKWERLSGTRGRTDLGVRAVLPPE